MPTWQEQFITSHRVARLATAEAEGQPHLVPIVYAYAEGQLYTPIDAKPKKVAAKQLQRVRNIQANPQVAVIIDDYYEDWQQLAWVQLRGRAEIVDSGPDHATGVRLLEAKYSQYQKMPLAHQPIIVITSERIIGWRAAEVAA